MPAEYGVLFKPAMVGAILDGRKTQTRRIVRLGGDTVAERSAAHARASLLSLDAEAGVATFGDSIPDDPVPIQIRAPYGGVGSTLWVRETWRPSPVSASGLDTKPDGYAVRYEADGAEHFHVAARIPESWRFPRAARRSVVSPLLMPRWASRIDLIVTGLRVERLATITARDIVAEGVVERRHDSLFGPQPVSAFDGLAYMSLGSLWVAGWDSINRKRIPFRSNPWVWVYSFRRAP